MLIQFSIKNFLSFGDETTLCMIPGKSRNKKDHIITCPTGKNISTLPLAIFYGSNASGKSNVYYALEFMRTMVLRSLSFGGTSKETSEIFYDFDNNS